MYIDTSKAIETFTNRSLFTVARTHRDLSQQGGGLPFHTTLDTASTLERQAQRTRASERAGFTKVARDELTVRWREVRTSLTQGSHGCQ